MGEGHCRSKKRIVCDKEPKLECSEVQSAEEWDISFHQAIIRGTFQRDPAASEGLLKAELSEMHQYSLRAVCLLSIPWSWLQESSPQTGYNLLWREFLSCWKRGKINSSWQCTERQQMLAHAHHLHTEYCIDYIKSKADLVQDVMQELNWGLWQKR